MHKRKGHLLKSVLSSLFIFNSLLLISQPEKEVFYESKTFNNRWLYSMGAENSLYWYNLNQAIKYIEKRNEEISEIKTKNDWENRRDYIKSTLEELIGPFPEKTALNAMVIRTITKEDFRIEHIIFESRPGFFVTSSLFIPANGKNKKPAILYCSGHSEDGYRGNVYQHVILNLVKKGFIVFAFDPVGQGERKEYFNPLDRQSIIGSATKEHSYAGAQAFLTAGSQAGYMAWDGIRAVDYLISRKEVDSNRIGITGRSGGGTQSAIIAAMDERIYAAAPECYITSLRRLFQSIGPQDAEQNLLNGVRRGLDHADFLTVRAPKPAMMITTTNDFFSIQGARETAAEVSKIYGLLDAEENFSRVEDLGKHESTENNRESMYAFFQRVLENPGSSDDKEVELLTEAELSVSHEGQVSISYNSESIFSLNRKYAQELRSKLNEKRSDRKSFYETVKENAGRLSGYENIDTIYDLVYTGRIQQGNYLVDKYFIKGEGNYILPFLQINSGEQDNKVLICLNPEGKFALGEEKFDIRYFVSKGFRILIPDMIGTGEMGPGEMRGDSYIQDVSYSTWFFPMLYGRSLTGIRAGDLNRLAGWASQEYNTEEIYCISEGEMAPVMLHAAVLEPFIKKMAMINPYSSYHSIVNERFYRADYIHSTVPSSLQFYDLPDLAAIFAPRRLLIYNMRDGKGKLSEGEIIEKDLEIIKEAYAAKNAMNDLIITSKLSDLQLREVIQQWSE